MRQVDRPWELDIFRNAMIKANCVMLRRHYNDKSAAQTDVSGNISDAISESLTDDIITISIIHGNA